MNINTGEIHNLNNKQVMDSLSRAGMIENLTTLSEKEHDAIKDIKQEMRPEELAWVRFKENRDMSEYSMKEAFIAGVKSKLKDQ